jgi:hypothetical protein
MSIDWTQIENFLLALGCVGSVVSGIVLFYMRKTFVTIGRFDALERRVETLVSITAFDELEKRVSSNERRLEAAAVKTDVSELQLTLERLNTTFGRMDERLKAMATLNEGLTKSVDRIEDHLLKSAGGK